ncbi:MAG: hypothetical protein R3234_11480, partial [Thermoanaerobaculia bacterium]|nr:hypothetical protein [Thermoanaerobaculia bacterium]
TPAGPLRAECRRRLQTVAERAGEARASLRPAKLPEAAEALAEILADLRDLRKTVGRTETAGPGIPHLLALLEEKEQLAFRALTAAAGLVFDAWTESPTAVAGGELEVTVTLWNGGPFPLRVPQSAGSLASSRGWLESSHVFSLQAPDEEGRVRDSAGPLGTLDPGSRGTATPSIRIAADAPVTVPYFLREPREGPFYDFGTVDPSLRGLPFGPEPLEAIVRVELEIGERSVPLTLRRPVVTRNRDLALGETRRPIRLVPRIEVEVAPDLLVWPENLGDREALEIQLRLHGEDARSGRLDLDTPPGWPAGESPTFVLSSSRRELGTFLEVGRPGDIDRGRYIADVAAVTEENERHALAVPLVRHPHVRPRPVPKPSRVEISTFDLVLPPLRRVGYVRGAADRVPETLSAVGIPLEEIPPGRLTEIDLGGYDALIVGSRAYESAPALHEATPRLNRYVREGGLLLVQFQRWEYFREGRPPVPVEMEGRGRRTTDETAPVEILRPGHRAFTWPNRIGPDDWEGWVQERGLYYPTSWGEKVTPLLSLSEPGDPGQRGSLLVAEVGEGTWVYTGLAFFRQLPAGVPGGFRLFANLLGLEAPQ